MDNGKEAPVKKTKKKKTIRYRSVKRQKEAKEGGQNALFLYKWENSLKKSLISGRDLSYLEEGSSLWRCCFMHILPKGRFPQYRLYSGNLILGHPEEHSLIDQGTEAQRRKYKEEWESKGYVVDWDVFYELQEKLKSFYPFM